MNKRVVRLVSIVLIIMAILPVSVFASTDREEGSFGGNIYSAGTTAVVKDSEARDIFCAGNTVSVAGNSVRGNIFAAGNYADIKNVYVVADIFAAGQSITISDAEVDGSLYVAGDSINVTGSDVGSAIIAGQNVSFDGKAGNVYISGQSVQISGNIYGDVVVDSKSVDIADDISISGTLTVKSDEEPDVPAGVYSNYVFEKNAIDESKVKEVTLAAKMIKKITSRLYWIPAMLLVAFALILLFGKNLDEAHDTIVNKPTGMILTGVIGWIAIPVSAFILAVTVIGLPLAVMVTMIYVLLLLVGLTFAGASLGRLAFRNLHPILASVIGVAILQIVRIVPVVGGMVAVAADMYTIGYVLYAIYTNAFVKKQPLVATIVEEKPYIEEMVVDTERAIEEIEEL